MSALRVVASGALTTVQDLGRPGLGPMGVSASGAFDPISLRAANRLADNAPEAAALEIALGGAALAAEDDVVVAIAGAELGARIEGTGLRRPLRSWTATVLRKGEVVRFGFGGEGARAYLAVAGGLDVPPVLGSRSTHLAAGLGGLEGRALRPGDLLRVGRPWGPRPPVMPRSLEALAPIVFRKTLRVVRGLQDAWFAWASFAAFLHARWEVTDALDRMGIRLRGPRLKLETPRELLTEGAPLGAIQIPEDGQPILLGVEHQTTGGYPKIANVIAADLPALGQLTPRDPVRFEEVSLAAARAILIGQERRLAEILR